MTVTADHVASHGLAHESAHGSAHGGSVAPGPAAFDPATDPDVFAWWTVKDLATIHTAAGSPPVITSIDNKRATTLPLIPPGVLPPDEWTYDPAFLFANGVKGCKLSSFGNNALYTGVGLAPWPGPMSFFSLLRHDVAFGLGTRMQLPAASLVSEAAGVFHPSGGGPSWMSANYATPEITAATNTATLGIYCLGSVLTSPPGVSAMYVNGAVHASGVLSKTPNVTRNRFMGGVPNILFGEGIILTAAVDATKAAAISAYMLGGGW